ncbi:MAG: protein kinase [Xenococcus sp. (in: cyanobacteria)]
MLNQLLGGHYRVVQNLEEGGLAQTYIAEDHHRPGCPKCAVKFLKPASNQPDFLPIARRLFNQEAEILEKLGQHDQIPRLLAYFEEKQEFYLVQEFIEGHTLSTELPRGHLWSEDKVIMMLQDVLQILEFVHSYGVIHRDIKPNNLIRRQKDGRLVLIDFGAVKQVRAPMINDPSALTQYTIAIGTQGYMPTEQVRGKPRLNSDIYALGMIGIQALTGLHPLHFREDEEGELIWQDMVNVSEELVTVLNNMVRYHFKDRYRSSTEALEALQPLLESSPLLTANSVKSTPLGKRGDPAAETAAKERAPEREPYPKVSLKGYTSIYPLGQHPSQSSFEVEAQSDLSPSQVDWDIETVVSVNSEAVTKSELQRTEIELEDQPLSSEVKKETDEIEAGSALKGRSTFDLQKTKAIVKFDLSKSEDWQLWLILKNQFAKFSSRSLRSRSRRDPLRGVRQQALWGFLAKLFDEEKKPFLVSKAALWASQFPAFLRLNKSQLIVGTGITSATIGILTGYSYINNSHLQAALAQIENLKAAGKYQECSQEAEILGQYYSSLQAQIRVLRQQCEMAQTEVQLTEARNLAAESKLKDAIALATQIPEDTKLYLEAQQLISQWSEQIFQIASNKYQEGDLETAIAIAKAVPSEHSVAEKVEVTIEQWNQEWQQNQTFLATAQKNLAQGRWQDAINSAQKVSKTNYWQQQSQPIIQKAQAKIAAIQAAAARKRSQPRSNSRASRSRSIPRSNSNASRPLPSSLRSRSVPRPNSTSSSSRSVTSSTYTRSRSLKRPGSTSPRSKSNDWICLNNPNPKCHQ